MSEIPNRVDTTFSQEALDALMNQLAQIDASFPMTTSLTPTERSVAVKMGQVHVGFINQALSLAETDSSYLPRSFSLERFQNDVTLTNQLAKIRDRMSALVKKLDDNYLAASSEAFKAALVVYNSARTSGPEELQPTVKEMGSLFKGGRPAEATE